MFTINIHPYSDNCFFLYICKNYQGSNNLFWTPKHDRAQGSNFIGRKGLRGVKETTKTFKKDYISLRREKTRELSLAFKQDV